MAGPSGQGREQRTRAIGPATHLGPSLVQRPVAAEQPEGLGHRLVGAEVAVQQLAKPRVGRDPWSRRREQRRQGRHALTQVGPRRLARLVAGDVDDVVAELEHDADLLAERRACAACTSGVAPASLAPNSAEVAIREPVLSAITAR